jgi:hypothetical protein
VSEFASRGWSTRRGAVIELTGAQQRKPLLGAGGMVVETAAAELVLLPRLRSGELTDDVALVVGR